MTPSTAAQQKTGARLCILGSTVTLTNQPNALTYPHPQSPTHTRPQREQRRTATFAALDRCSALYGGVAMYAE